MRNAPKRNFRITSSMVQAGTDKLTECRDLGGHTPATLVQAIFQAMLDAACLHPGPAIKSGREPQTHKWKLSDFDANGMRQIGTGEHVRYIYARNYHYLRAELKARQAQDKTITKP